MVYVFPGLTPIITSNVSSATVTLIEKSTVSAGPPPPPNATGSARPKAWPVPLAAQESIGPKP